MMTEATPNTRIRTPARRSRSSSTFSNQNLTTLESLVLEVALEDAGKVTSIDGCEMDADLFDQLSCLPGNDHCADCNSSDTPEWASVSFGILLCATCSGIHRALGTHISRVRSIKMDSWSKEHVKLMQAGGNQKCQEYLAEHGGFLLPAATVNVGGNDDDDDDDENDIDIEEKYSSEAAQDYKMMLKDVSTGRTENPLDSSNGLDDIESSTESAGPGFGSDNIKAAPLDRHDTPTTIDCSNRSSLDGSYYGRQELASILNIGDLEEKGEEDEKETPLEDESKLKDDSKKEPISRMSLNLDGWFSKTSSTHSSSTGETSLSAASNSGHHQQRSRRAYKRSMSSASSASAPTITYMGRSFSADGSDDSKLLSKHAERIRRNNSDVKLLVDLADEEEHNARESVSSTWIGSIPANHFLVDKKIEPFLLGGGSLHSPFSSLRGSKKPTRIESMCQKLAYTDEDLLQIALDDKEFARLKAGLKNKGAVTNEMLRQKLYAFIANSKSRKSAVAALRKSTTVSIDGSDNRRVLSASKSEDLSLLRSYTTHTATADRG